MTSENGSRLETIDLKRPDITPEFLKKDNASETARILSAKWEENRDNGNLWVIVACGDARVLIPCPENIMSIRSIATGGKKEKKILVSQGVKMVVVMSHIDGKTIIPGKRGRGCGGGAAKEEAINEKEEHKEHVEGIRYYIDNNIDHPDTMIQAYITAYKIAKETKKPTLAVVQDHRTGKIYPFAAFVDGYDIVNSKLDQVGLSKEYNEAEIYADGIPALPETVIPEIFKEFINASKEYMSEMLRTYPNLDEIQETQNPSGVWISSKLPSIRTRYPEATKFPNLFFKLHLPREKDGSKIEITQAMQKEIINQAQYPIEHSIKHFGKPNESFSRTNRIIIETSDINVSRNLAAELAKKQWMKTWLDLPDLDHRIIIIQNKEGISNQIDYFPKE
ncbi:MAG: hypothetical protein HW400_450 [Candidatus Levybacteria bacterium]|nr:hypothetical protein [Candidatus Levybacteria bacterium]